MLTNFDIGRLFKLITLISYLSRNVTMIKLGHIAKMPKTVSGTHLVFSSNGYSQFQILSRSRINAGRLGK